MTFFQQHKRLIIIGIIILILIVVEVVWSPRFSRSEENLRQSPFAATVLSNSASARTLTVRALDTNEEYTVRISPDTIVKKVVTEKDAEGNPVRQTEIETDMWEIGETPTISYSRKENGALAAESIVSFEYTEDLNAYIAALTPSMLVFFDAEVVSFDPSNLSLAYSADDMQSTLILQPNTPIYRVHELERAHIDHARTPASTEDLRRGTSMRVGLAKENKALAAIFIAD